FDKEHNSYFKLARKLRDQEDVKRPSAEGSKRLEEALRELESSERSAQLAGLEKLSSLGQAASSALGRVHALSEKTSDAEVRERALAVVKKIMAPKAYPAAAVRPIEE